MSTTKPGSDHNEDGRQESEDTLEVGRLRGVSEDDQTDHQAQVGEDREEGERRNHGEQRLEVALTGPRSAPAAEPTHRDDQSNVDHDTNRHCLQKHHLDQGLYGIEEEDYDNGRKVVDYEREEDENTPQGHSLNQVVHETMPAPQHRRIPGVVVGIMSPTHLHARNREVRFLLHCHCHDQLQRSHDSYRPVNPEAVACQDQPRWRHVPAGSEEHD